MSTKAALDRAKSRAREMASKIWHGSKGSLMSAGTGFAAFHVEQSLRGMDFFKSTQNADGTFSQAYRVPLAMAIGGHLLKKKQHDAGTSLLAVAGYQLANELHQHAVAKQGSTLNVGVPNVTPAPPVKGIDDAYFLPPAAGIFGADASGMFGAGVTAEASGVGDGEPMGDDDDY